MGAPSAPSGGATVQDQAEAADGSTDPTPLNMPRRFTLSMSVTQGRYEIRGRRANAKNKGTSAADTVIWESCRSFMASETTFGNVTLLSVMCRATSGVNNNTANKVNVIATRRLPTVEFDMSGVTWPGPDVTFMLPSSWVNGLQTTLPVSGVKPLGSYNSPALIAVHPGAKYQGRVDDTQMPGSFGGSINLSYIPPYAKVTVDWELSSNVNTTTPCKIVAFFDEEFIRIPNTDMALTGDTTLTLDAITAPNGSFTFTKPERARYMLIGMVDATTLDGVIGYAEIWLSGCSVTYRPAIGGVYHYPSGSLKGTRSPIDAFCDIVYSYYGGNLGGTFLDLVSLTALRTRLDELGGQNFDYVFDTRTTVWDALSTVARAVRCQPSLNGSLLTMVRDERDAPPVAFFTPDNIVSGSFQYQTKLTDIDEYDGMLVTYLDDTSWKQETVLCCAKTFSGAQIEFGNNPENLTLPGVTNRDRAYKEGLYIRQAKRLLRNAVTFSTGLEGYIPGLGDVIQVAYDVPNWGSTGLIRDFLTDPDTGAAILIIPSLPKGYTYGATGWVMMLRDKYGMPYELGAIESIESYPTFGQATSQWWAVFLPVASGPIDTTRFSAQADGDPVLYNIGTGSRFSRKCVIDVINPGDNDQISITAHTYEQDVFNGTDPDDPPAPPIPVPDPPEGPGGPIGFPPNAPPVGPVPDPTGFNITLDESQYGEFETDCHVETPAVSFYAEKPFALGLVSSTWPVISGPTLDSGTPDPITGKYASGRYKVSLVYAKCPVTTTAPHSPDPDTAVVSITY